VAIETRVPKWVPVARHAVAYHGEIWIVCPVNGFDCARIPRHPYGELWGSDVMAVHVAIHHRRWR
jgi:hypothetical protein